MWRRFVYTLLGVLAGYLLGAIVGMTLFTVINGYRSISVLEESNRNRWTFVVASAAAVLGGLIAWWRSYTDLPPGSRRSADAGRDQADNTAADTAADAVDETVDDRAPEDAEPGSTSDA